MCHKSHTHTNYIDNGDVKLLVQFSWLSSVNAIPPEEIWKYNRIFLSLGTEHIHAICLEPPRVICPSSIVKLLTAITLTKHAACVPPSANNEKFSSPHEKTRMQCFSLSAAQRIRKRMVFNIWFIASWPLAHIHCMWRSFWLWSTVL